MIITTIITSIYFVINGILAGISFRDNAQGGLNKAIGHSAIIVFFGLLWMAGIAIGTIIIDPARRWVKGGFERKFKR